MDEKYERLNSNRWLHSFTPSPGHGIIYHIDHQPQIRKAFKRRGLFDTSKFLFFFEDFLIECFRSKGSCIILLVII